MNLRVPAYIVVALAMLFGAAVTSAFGQPMNEPRFQSVAQFPAQERHTEALRVANVALQEALVECRTLGAFERVDCERVARGLYRNQVGLANARLAHDFAARG